MKFTKLFILTAVAFAALSGCMTGEGSKPPTKYEMGARALRNNDPQKAITYLEQSIAENPQDPNALFSLAAAYGLTGNKDKEFELLQKSVEVDPNFAAGYYYMGVAYNERGEMNPALDSFEKAIEINPINESAYFEIAKIYEANDGPRSALEFYKKAAELGSSDAQKKVAELEAQFNG
jgi:tetratricopeptide (TPR) repeat protein